MKNAYMIEMETAIYWTQYSTQAQLMPGKLTWKARIRKVKTSQIQTGRKQLQQTQESWNEVKGMTKVGKKLTEPNEMTDRATAKQLPYADKKKNNMKRAIR